ncbi:MAG: hypothetical protein RMK84_13680 [Oscillochloridaceae bacterium]|nr:hypothetical protein [Chloroflexaceae bacterium]MDW8391172.1 hypothetical protein [Oscillochloridaceae bacterium]
MIVHPFPEPAPHRHPYRRLCSFAPASLHVYRRALLRRFGLPAGNRPAAVLDAVARALLQARVS